MKYLTILIMLLDMVSIPCCDIDYETIVNRDNNVLIVEKLEGYRINDNGDGKLVNNGEYGDYIYYDIDTDELITTYCIYNPETQYEDDIILRVDVTMDGNVYFN